MATEVKPTIRNGWQLKCFALFLRRLEELVEYVEELERDDPEGFQHHAATKLLMSVWKAVEENVPSNPGASQFQCATLGNGGRWRRVKQGLPQRYRLFFQFNTPEKTIIYVWLNDENCLRKAGAKTDVYQTFLGMTKMGKIPSGFAELLTSCEYLPPSGTADK